MLLSAVNHCKSELDGMGLTPVGYACIVRGDAFLK